MSDQEAPRRMVQGVQVLLLKTGPYIEVAERVRSVHKAGKSFSFERGEVLRIHNRWIYRASITVDGQQYIGDAEIHFGSPSNTPDGTNPITCGQTSAIGNALTFAGFGDPKSIFARLGLRLECEEEFATDSSRRLIEDIEVIMLNEQPYVTVAERIYFIHLTGKTLSMQQCKLLQYNDVWIYRASITVDGQQYIGDAEIYFDAMQEPDRTYPISCGQTSAVGNALAFAGFGDVRSIMERCGKEVPDTLEGRPLLASADAMHRALRYASVRDQKKESPNVVSRNDVVGSTGSKQKTSITPQQRERIQLLCERLGESEPDYTTITYEEAVALLAQLEVSEEELLLAADDAEQQVLSQRIEAPQYVSSEVVRGLKEAWLETFRVAGTTVAKRSRWVTFKRRTCQVDVDDAAMLSSQHDQLFAAILAEEQRCAVPVPASQVVQTSQGQGS